MWKPAKDVHWQEKAECAKPEYQNLKDLFFSQSDSDRNEAKGICASCPVRKECLQWALEHKQLWGIWGGRDELEIRRTLSVSYLGEEVRRRRPPNCPYCGARPYRLEVSTEDFPGGGRWTTAKVVSCTKCEFSWRSRTSVNAVMHYNNSRKSKN